MPVGSDTVCPGRMAAQLNWSCADVCCRGIDGHGDLPIIPLLEVKINLLFYKEY